MKKITTLVGALLIGSTLFAQTTNWAFDNAHSKVGFAVSHMVISETEGQFKEYSGTVLSDKDDFTDAKINFTIQAASIDTDNEKRDGHLKNADFFDVEKYPTLSLKNAYLTKSKDGKYKLTGDFTMHGVTKTMSFDVKFGGVAQDPWGNTRAGFKVTGVIDRTQFGMDGSTGMVGTEVAITANIELIKQ
jgi:polyisoprenoid-binding protein YceI